MKYGFALAGSLMSLVTGNLSSDWYLVIMRIISYYQGMLIGFVAGLMFAYIYSVLRKKRN